MKLKQLPDDFQVEELTDVKPAGAGLYALYSLEKRGWSTPDALAAVRKRWKIDLRRMSVGGLKDRHARTLQYFTIFHGPQRNLTHQEVTVHHLGMTDAPYTSKDIRANRFQIVLRNINSHDVGQIEQVIEEIQRDGVPNYFDDQRFGSVANGEFIARSLVLGRWEEGLRLALVAANEHDRAGQKREKEILRTHWGNWQICQQHLPGGHARELVNYLVNHPGDFRGAVARLHPELRGLYLSAYQSHLWNRMLARWLTQRCRPDQLVKVALKLGEVPMHRQLDPDQHQDLAAMQLPLPSARLHVDPDDARASLVNSVVAEEGLQLRQLQIKGIREMFFSKGERAALCMPAELHCDIAVDELHPERQKAKLAFELPRGCYATLIVKRIQQSHVTGNFRM
jgi:tRNA pseudouridine13 synthase